MKSLRLKSRERRAVRARWKENPVFAAFSGYCTEKCRGMHKLEYEPEEVFYAVFVVLDNLKSQDGEWHAYVDGLGDRVKNQIAAGYDIPDEELWMAMCEILSIVVLIIMFWRDNQSLLYNQRVMNLLREIDPSGAEGMKEQALLINSVSKEIMREVESFAREYMNGEDRISDQIAGLLEDEESIDLLGEEVEDEVIDKILATSIAIETFRKLREAKILDSHNMPVENLSWAEKGILADAIAEHVGIEDKWDFFKKLWNVKNKETLRSAYNKGLNTNKGWEFKNKIEKIIK